MGLPCKCRKNCRSLLLGKEYQIFNAFWDLGDYDKQNLYLFSQMKAVPKKRTYPKKVKREVSSRKISIQYFVKVDGIDVKICKAEFLAVHGLHNSKKRIQLLYEQMGQGASTPKSDKRGKHANRPNKISEEAHENVKRHIDAIPKYTSHYSRQKNPGKVYIDHDLSIASLYNDYYLDWCKDKGISPVKESYYRRIFCSEYNIGFKLPKSDTCKTCDFLRIQIESSNGKNEAENKSFKCQLELHQGRAAALQNSLKEEIEKAKTTNDTLVLTFDLQQALPVPNLTVGPAFYLRKAWVYNLGLHDCLTDKGYMYMWPENVAKRGSDEIASILYKHFKENPQQYEKLIVYSDNCSGQNKNWSVICLWHQLVKEKIFKTIEHRFQVVGHTHLPSDRDFAIIERYKRRYLKEVYVPDDWYKAVQKSRRKNPFSVIVISQEDILCFKDLQNQIVKKTLTDQKEKLGFSKIIAFKFTHETTNVMFIKHDFNEEFKPVSIGKRGLRAAVAINFQDLKKKYAEPVALNPKKISNLCELSRFIPPAYMQYYRDIGVVENVQVALDPQDDEVEHLDVVSEMEGDDDNSAQV